jgi:tryptophan synthase beta chain
VGFRTRLRWRAVWHRHTGLHGSGFLSAEALPAGVDRGAIDEALRCKEEGVSRSILFNLCGHGHFDMQAYSDYFAGKLVDQSCDEAELAMALAGLPSVPAV